MVKQASELKVIGNTVPDISIVQESGGNIAPIFISKDLQEHSTLEAANARNAEIDRQIKSDQTVIGPDELRKLLKR